MVGDRYRGAGHPRLVDETGMQVDHIHEGGAPERKPLQIGEAELGPRVAQTELTAALGHRAEALQGPEQPVGPYPTIASFWNGGRLPKAVCREHNSDLHIGSDPSAVWHHRDGSRRRHGKTKRSGRV